MAIWIRGNFFIPDARVFWVRPSVRFLRDYLKKNPVDLIVSSGPPHSLHLIAKGLKKHSHLPWVADFRDPWTGIYYFDKLKLTVLSKWIHHRMEQQCLEKADHLITVGQTMKNDFAKRTKTPISVITNGFDEADFVMKGKPTSDKFSILYSGMFLPDQNPTEFWEVLQELVKENKSFSQQLRLHFIGRCDAKILQDIKDHDLHPYLVLEDYVSHAALPALQQAASVLLLSINRIENASYILTGKVFEYLAAARPILAFCPENSDVANIINETHSGYPIAFGQKAQLKALLIELFELHQNNQLTLKGQDVSAYSRKVLTRQLTEIFDLQL
jgi:glycosyltransferase involved in cell wall biosynthesis